MNWKRINKDTPRDRHLLLIGTQIHHNSVNIKGEIVFSGYWDEIDGGWCSTGSTWEGPFYNVRLWANLPEIPK
jgi:hypothetical protein